MLTPEQAGTILDLIEAATSGNWPNTMRHMMEELGYTPEQMHGAWTALDEIEGRDSCPLVEDFEVP
tara:strand:- start:1130 stop:1327 length:198 start_codon:yes stop_codon:yes gene_type:complete